jgi:hypothetical protein
MTLKGSVREGGETTGAVLDETFTMKDVEPVRKPLALTCTAMLTVLGTCAGVGVQVNMAALGCVTWLAGVIVALLGAPEPKTQVSVLALTAFVTETVIVRVGFSETLRFVLLMGLSPSCWP